MWETAQTQYGNWASVAGLLVSAVAAWQAAGANAAAKAAAAHVRQVSAWEHCRAIEADLDRLMDLLRKADWADALDLAGEVLSEIASLNSCFPTRRGLPRELVESLVLLRIDLRNAEHSGAEPLDPVVHFKSLERLRMSVLTLRSEVSRSISEAMR